MHFSRSRLILSKNLIYFRRGREIGSHAWRRSTKFHGDYVNQHHTDSRSSSDYRKCKTIFSDSHLPRHVTIVNRHFCKVKVVWKKLKHFFFFSRHLIEIMYRKITLPLVHVGSRSRAETLWRWNPNVRKRRCDRFRVGSKKNLFASKLKARDSTADSFPRISVSPVAKSKENYKVSRNHVTFV